MVSIRRKHIHRENMAMNGFLRNAWYMAAWVQEVPEGGLLARKLLGDDWVIWRKGDGQWAMLVDRCPHRFAPLSKGRRVGDTLRCGYHGLSYDHTGACVHNPFGPAVPPGMKVPAMAPVERHSALWFWPGDPALADPASIPDFSFMQAPNHVRVALMMDVDYRLIVDNLMDLTHVEFMHVETFGANGSMLDHGRQSVVTEADGAIWNKWAVENAAPPTWAEALLPAGHRVDQWRPIHAWTASQVWAIIGRRRIRPHPAYCLGWGRLSCRCCIFGSADQWATLRAMFPDAFAVIAQRERASGETIYRRLTVDQLADLGSVYPAASQNPDDLAQAKDRIWRLSITMTPWALPAGAKTSDSAGPS